MAQIETILVVGGGVAGLTAAAALHRHGFTTELVERQQTWHALGAGFLVHANGMRMLLSLGLAAGVENAGAVVRRWQFCNEQGDVLSETDLETLWGNAGPCVGIERPKLQRALLPGVADDSARRSPPWSRMIVVPRSGSLMARPETMISWLARMARPASSRAKAHPSPHCARAPGRGGPERFEGRCDPRLRQRQSSVRLQHQGGWDDPQPPRQGRACAPGRPSLVPGSARTPYGGRRP